MLSVYLTQSGRSPLTNPHNFCSHFVFLLHSVSTLETVSISIFWNPQTNLLLELNSIINHLVCCQAFVHCRCQMFQEWLRTWELGCMVNLFSLWFFRMEGISVSFTALYSASICSPSDGKGHNRCPTPSLFKSTWLSSMIPMVNVMHHFHSPNVHPCRSFWNSH